MEKEYNFKSQPINFQNAIIGCKRIHSMKMNRHHLLEGRKLSEEETHILHRWETAHSLFVSKNETDANAARILMKMYNISNFTAYKDIRNAKMLFGDAYKASTEGLRYIVSQWCIDMYRMAYIAKDFDAMSNALGKLIKANCLDRQDPNLPDITKIQPPVQVLSLSLDFVNSPYFKMLVSQVQEEVDKTEGESSDHARPKPDYRCDEYAMIEDTKYEPVNDDTDSWNKFKLSLHPIIIILSWLLNMVCSRIKCLSVAVVLVKRPSSPMK